MRGSDGYVGYKPNPDLAQRWWIPRGDEKPLQERGDQRHPAGAHIRRPHASLASIEH
jgi:hypothetical protein